MQTEKVADYIVNWLNEYCEQAGTKGFVVGVSGGIDSAVTSTLCAKTKKPVIVLNMHIYQNPTHVDLAQKHIAWLENQFPNVSSKTLDLTGSFQSIEKTLPPENQEEMTLGKNPVKAADDDIVFVCRAPQNAGGGHRKQGGRFWCGVFYEIRRWRG